MKPLEQEKRMKEIYITIIDENEVNQHALFLMISTLKITNKNILDKLYVIYPQYLSGCDFLNLLENENIIIWKYDFKPTEDRYFVKFLICDFIMQNKNGTGIVTYIDPDHIFLRKLMEITPNKDEVILSSENNKSENEYFSKYTHKNGSFINYNTSYISARISTWCKVIDKWKENYYKFNNQISNRFREEVSFSFSLVETRMKIRQLPSDIQSNFKVFDSNCIMFHYGGEYNSAINIKAILETNKEVSYIWIKNNYDNAINFIEKWYWDSLLRLFGY